MKVRQGHDWKSEMVASEVLYTVKKGVEPVLRPDLHADPDVNPTLVALIKDCWAEKPEDRPVADEICKLLFEWTPK